MNCWKTINLSRDLGNQRLFVVSLLVMLIAFIMIYVPLSIINESIHLNDNYMLLFIICLFLLIPIHNLCHALPVWLVRKNVLLKINFHAHVLPIVKIEYNHSLSKTLKMVSIITPTLLITCPLLFCSMQFPEYLHYFSIMTAINIGLSVTDIIYLLILLKAPKKCIVEHTNHSFDILIQDNR